MTEIVVFVYKNRKTWGNAYDNVQQRLVKIQFFKHTQFSEATKQCLTSILDFSFFEETFITITQLQSSSRFIGYAISHHYLQRINYGKKAYQVKEVEWLLSMHIPTGSKELRTSQNPDKGKINMLTSIRAKMAAYSFLLEKLRYALSEILWKYTVF